MGRLRLGRSLGWGTSGRRELISNGASRYYNEPEAIPAWVASGKLSSAAADSMASSVAFSPSPAKGPAQPAASSVRITSQIRAEEHRIEFFGRDLKPAFYGRTCSIFIHSLIVAGGGAVCCAQPISARHPETRTNAVNQSVSRIRSGFLANRARTAELGLLESHPFVHRRRGRFRLRIEEPTQKTLPGDF